MMIDIRRALITKVLYESNSIKYDSYGTDEDKYKFSFYIRISKCYTLRGVIYRVEVPNYTDHDKSIYRLIDRVINYIHDNGMRYVRLEEKLRSKDMWKHLE